MMKKIAQAVLSLTLMCWIMRPAYAEQVAANCTSILSIGSGEADLVYYQAEADLGTDTANRLWTAYHRLKNKCTNNATAKIVVNVEPRIRAFLEAHR
jgi:hypothetical protein